MSQTSGSLTHNYVRKDEHLKAIQGVSKQVEDLREEVTLLSRNMVELGVRLDRNDAHTRNSQRKKPLDRVVEVPVYRDGQKQYPKNEHFPRYIPDFWKLRDASHRK